MDTKLILLVALMATFITCVLSIDPAARSDVEEEEKRVVLVKKSADDLFSENDWFSAEANIVKSRQKRGVFYGSYVTMSIICAVGVLVMFIGLGYCVFMLVYRKDRLGTAVGEEEVL
jgi:hypothetical protein